jgi:hypothetical protein
MFAMVILETGSYFLLGLLGLQSSYCNSWDACGCHHAQLFLIDLGSHELFVARLALNSSPYYLSLSK